MAVDLSELRRTLVYQNLGNVESILDDMDEVQELDKESEKKVSVGAPLAVLALLPSSVVSSPLLPVKPQRSALSAPLAWWPPLLDSFIALATIVQMCQITAMVCYKVYCQSLPPTWLTMPK